MTSTGKLVRENVKRLIPYSCARDEFSGKTGIFMDANENPYGTLNRYPDPYQKDLKKAVAAFKGVSQEMIFLGNGSDEIIDLCYRVFCNPGKDTALIFPPTYGMYEVSASINEIEIIRVPLDENFQIDISKTEPLLNDPHLKMIFICSPNNPTGNAMNREIVERIIQNFGGIVVIDEAYADFSEKDSFLSLVGKYNNLILMQTFSKAMGMAAIRIGMAFADPEIIGFFNKLKPPYNISTINQVSALKKLGRPEELRLQVARIKKERGRLSESLKKLHFVEKIYPSDANFLFLKVTDASKIYNDLISRNIIIRNRSSVVENCIRITVGKKRENDELLKALRRYSKNMNQ